MKYRISYEKFLRIIINSQRGSFKFYLSLSTHVAFIYFLPDVSKNVGLLSNMHFLKFKRALLIPH